MRHWQLGPLERYTMTFAQCCIDCQLLGARLTPSDDIKKT